MSTLIFRMSKVRTRVRQHFSLYGHAPWVAASHVFQCEPKRTPCWMTRLPNGAARRGRAAPFLPLTWLPFARTSVSSCKPRRARHVPGIRLARRALLYAPHRPHVRCGAFLPVMKPADGRDPSAPRAPCASGIRPPVTISPSRPPAGRPSVIFLLLVNPSRHSCIQRAPDGAASAAGTESGLRPREPPMQPHARRRAATGIGRRWTRTRARHPPGATRPLEHTRPGLPPAPWRGWLRTHSPKAPCARRARGASLLSRRATSRATPRIHRVRRDQVRAVRSNRNGPRRPGDADVARFERQPPADDGYWLDPKAYLRTDVMAAPEGGVMRAPVRATY